MILYCFEMKDEMDAGGNPRRYLYSEGDNMFHSEGTSCTMTGSMPFDPVSLKLALSQPKCCIV